MSQDTVIARFMAPRYAVPDVDSRRWQADAGAETPGADAWCHLWLRYVEADRIDVRFQAYGPPVVIAAADWLCERLAGETIAQARGLTTETVEKALSLAPDQRYAGLLAIDALTNVLSKLGR